MLVLGRKAGQRVVLSGGVVVTVLRVDGKKVRLGIEAPDSTQILRGEVAADVRDGGPGCCYRAGCQEALSGRTCLAGHEQPPI